ncbi:MAG: hypothetical protein ACLFN3_02075 [Halochromatium sp.]
MPISSGSSRRFQPVMKSDPRSPAAAKRGHSRRQGADANRPSTHRHPRRTRSQETPALLGGRDD